MLSQIPLCLGNHQVRNIVDKATKELSMEKTLREMDSTWAGMEFESEQHRRTGVMLLKSSEELIEILEDNQVRYIELKRMKIIVPCSQGVDVVFVTYIQLHEAAYILSISSQKLLYAR